jgi:hypothetical protein
MSYLINYYTNVEKIQFKNYEVNDKVNLELLFLIEDLYNRFKSKKIEVIFTGSWAFIFHFQKIYRTLKDIDLIVLKENYVNLLHNLLDFEYIYPENPENFFSCFPKTKQYGFYKESSPINHLKWSIQTKGDQPNKLIQKNTNLNIEVIIGDYTKDEILNVEIGPLLIKYRLPYKFLKLNDPIYSYGRQKDQDDNQFYSQYL